MRDALASGSETVLQDGQKLGRLCGDKKRDARKCTADVSTDSLKDLQKLRTKHRYENMYICKNLFYFQVEQYSTFGEKHKFLHFVPHHYSVKKTKQANIKYRINNLSAEHEDSRKNLEELVTWFEQYQEPQRIDIESMQKKPI